MHFRVWTNDSTAAGRVILNGVDEMRTARGSRDLLRRRPVDIA